MLIDGIFFIILYIKKKSEFGGFWVCFQKRNRHLTVTSTGTPNTTLLSRKAISAVLTMTPTIFFLKEID
jgi:hypothetical protein